MKRTQIFKSTLWIISWCFETSYPCTLLYQRQQNTFYPKGGRFWDNIFLNFMISSQPVIEGRSLICSRWFYTINLDNVRNFFSQNPPSLELKGILLPTVHLIFFYLWVRKISHIYWLLKRNKNDKMHVIN